MSYGIGQANTRAAYQAATDEKSPPTPSRGIFGSVEKLDGQIGALMEIAHRLGLANDRMFGPVPAEATAIKPNAEQAGGSFQLQLDRRITALEHALCLIAHEAGRYDGNLI
jgi:hypothetical protein